MVIGEDSEREELQQDHDQQDDMFAHALLDTTIDHDEPRWGEDRSSWDGGAAIQGPEAARFEGMSPPLSGMSGISFGSASDLLSL